MILTGSNFDRQTSWYEKIAFVPFLDSSGSYLHCFLKYSSDDVLRIKPYVGDLYLDDFLYLIKNDIIEIEFCFRSILG